MKLSKVFLFLSSLSVLFGLLSACTDSNRNKTADLLGEKEQKVSLYLDSLQRYTDVDFSHEEQSNEQLVKYSTQLDTSDLLKIEDFAMSLRMLRKANQRIDGIIEEGILTKNQLISLENDIRNGFLSEQEYQEYAAIEDSAAVVFISSASKMLDLYRRNIATLETTKPLADSLVEALARRGYR